MGIKTKAASLVISQVARRRDLVESYAEYWSLLEPRSHREYADRWTFAVTSIVNTWENNCRAHEFVAALGHPLTAVGREGLEQKLQESRCGVHERRARSLWEFGEGFWRKPSDYYPRPGESLLAFRDRLVGQVYGIGPAKLSFVIEMLKPLSCEVICVDRHMLNLYGFEKETSTSLDTYKTIEGHWVSACRREGLPAPLARHVWWDQRQTPVRWSTRYWSNVLEDPVRRARGYYDVKEPTDYQPLMF